MMKKNVFGWMLMTAMVVGLSMSVTSCKDDDDAMSEEQQRQEQAKMDEKDAAWMVLSQLVDPMTAGDDWTQQTFEPAIGEADAENALTRVVMTNTLANAAQRFANLVGLETMDSTTATYTYTNAQLGTLTYQRSSDGLSLATVTVDIKAVPKLQQIVYRRPDQTGENGLFSSSFDGRAYYRFGDVVCLKNNELQNEYWVCVRPSIGYEGKGDSHWVTLSPLTDDNIKEKKVGNKTFRVPTKLGTDKENTENFGELLTSILDNNFGWRQHYADEDADEVFHDLNLDDHLTYQNDYFWDIVKEGWEQKGVARAVFGPSIKNNNELLALLKDDGIRLLYNGFSWSLIGDKCTLYQATLKGPGANQGLSNLLKPEYTTVVKDMRQCAEFDGKRLEQQDIDNFFTDGKQRWCIRHATGKQLGGGRYDVKKSLMTTNPDIQDYYVYYRYAEERGSEQFDLSRKPERTTLTDLDLPMGINTGKRGYFMFGDVVKDDDGNCWICVQSSRPDEGQKYSYFISFDKCVKNNGSTDFTQLPTLDVAKQVLYAISDERYFYYPVRTANYPYYNVYTSLERETGFQYGKFLTGRETIVYNENEPDERVRWSPITHYVFNMLYRDPADGKAYILRLAEEDDATVKLFQEGNNTWRFYTCYPKDLKTAPRPMSVDDMSNQQIVNQYANADFVNWPWLYYDYDMTHTDSVKARVRSVQNSLDKDYQDANDEVNLAQTQLTGFYYDRSDKGPRTQTSRKDDKQWQLDNDVDLRYGNLRGTNMYKEPVMMFAVKRCVDNGTKPYKFADANNTPLYHWVTNSSDKYGKLYYTSKSAVTYYMRFNEKANSKMFWVDDKKVAVPFNMATPIN